jgi:hypothetical protein
MCRAAGHWPVLPSVHLVQRLPPGRQMPAIAGAAALAVAAAGSSAAAGNSTAVFKGSLAGRFGQATFTGGVTLGLTVRENR